MTWESVIGLEVHVELSTRTKLFCGCKTEFGLAPNTQICEVCTGMPGALPVLNKKAVEYAVRTGLALGCEIARETRFDRKNYFYPDLPKAYQISQLYAPICLGGHVDIDCAGGKKRITLHEIHIEEDAGKLVHDSLNGRTLIDYNRCGVVLLEIVTNPDFKSSDEVIAFLESLRRTLTYIGVSDCKMQEGSMRADVNLSLRPAGEKALGTRTEMKNLSSYRDIANAVKHETVRQTKLLENGEKILQQTVRWDADKKRITVLRTKENTHDYRYFPEPDLPPVVITREYIGDVKKALPELPEAKKKRYTEAFGLSAYDAGVLTENVNIAGFFEQAVSLGAPPVEAAKWISGEVLRLLKESSTEARHNPLSANALVKIIELVSNGSITRNTGKDVLEKAYYDKIEPMQYVEQHALKVIGDSSVIVNAVEKVISENQKSVADYKNGKSAALTYIIGQTMKELKGKADACLVRKTIEEKLK